jgi:hypothetical protein
LHGRAENKRGGIQEQFRAGQERKRESCERGRLRDSISLLRVSDSDLEALIGSEAQLEILLEIPR